MAKMMAIALPVIAIGAAAFTGGTSLAALAGSGAADAGLEGIVGSGIAADAGMADSMATATTGASWIGNTVASVTPYLKGVAAIGQIGGTVMQAVGAKQAGDAAKTQANSEANQEEQNASNQEAAAEGKMVQQNKETAYVLSNAQAAAAAGGGSATDPTVVTNMKTIAGEGRYRALTDMYQGDAAAQADRNQAAALRYGGGLASDAGNTKAVTAVISGASSLFDKYASVNKDNTLPPWMQTSS